MPPSAAPWSIKVFPAPQPRPDPHGYIVANFSAHCSGRSATGIIIRGPKGLAIYELEMRTSSWFGLDAEEIRGFPVADVLASASNVLGLPLVEVPPSPCPCGHH